jgi:hypothetical protein
MQEPKKRPQSIPRRAEKGAHEMTDDNDSIILDPWLAVVRIERVPRDLQLRVLRRLIAKLEKSDPRGRPKRKPGRPRKAEPPNATQK